MNKLYGSSWTHQLCLSTESMLLEGLWMQNFGMTCEQIQASQPSDSILFMLQFWLDIIDDVVLQGLRTGTKSLIPHCEACCYLHRSTKTANASADSKKVCFADPHLMSRRRT